MRIRMRIRMGINKRNIRVQIRMCIGVRIRMRICKRNIIMCVGMGVNKRYIIMRV